MYLERDPHWTDWCEVYARKAAWKGATELYKVCGTYQENLETFFRLTFGSGAASRSGVDAEERDYC